MIRNKETSQIVSRQRVTDHAEVYTAKREVNAMLNLVRHECERVDSRFLEPACGTGNFLVEILSEKLKIIAQKYAKSQLEFERNSILAISSIYGIDLLLDNVIACRERLLNVFKDDYLKLYKKRVKVECVNSASYILSKNISHGDALTLMTAGNEAPHTPITFTEWSFVSGSMLKRRDFIFEHLVEITNHNKPSLFSDLDEKVYIPEPVKDYPLIHFLEVANG